MRLTTLIICTLATIASATAQKLNFEHETWDFGAIEEKEGMVSHKFKFTNSGEAPLVIYNIRSSCGCTTTEYSNQPIMAGDSSTIEVTYDPTNRPGVFMRDIYIYSTAGKEPTIIQITGSVTAKSLTIEQRYPYAVGEKARVSATHISAGMIVRGIMANAKVELLNVSADTIAVKLNPRTPKEYLHTEFEQMVAPAKSATLEAGYLFGEADEMVVGVDGRVADTLDIFIDGKNSGRWLRVSGVATK